MGLVIGLVASALVTGAVLFVSRRLGLFDVPTGRSSHTRPIPRLGGIGIAAGSILAVSASGTLGDSGAVAVTLGALFMAIVGLTDDLRALGARAKLGLQFLAAGAVAVAIQPSWMLELPGLTLTSDSWLGVVGAVIWIVAICNAVNFIDGIDGLAAASIAVAALGAGVLAESAASAAMFVAVAGAAAGFLVWNWHPASIFMGDSGSQFLGFFLAGGLLISADAVPAIPSLLLVAPILFDTGATLVTRAARHERLFEAHRSHLYQRLSDLLGQRRVATIYAVAGATCAGAAIIYQTASDTVQGGILVLCVLAMLTLLISQRQGWLSS